MGRGRTGGTVPGTGTEGCVFVWCLSEDTSVVSGETRLESEDEFPGTVFIRITRQLEQASSFVVVMLADARAPQSLPHSESCGKSPAAPGKLREVSSRAREVAGSLESHPGS